MPRRLVSSLKREGEKACHEPHATFRSSLPPAVSLRSPQCEPFYLGWAYDAELSQVQCSFRKLRLAVCFHSPFVSLSLANLTASTTCIALIRVRSSKHQCQLQNGSMSLHYPPAQEIMEQSPDCEACNQCHTRLSCTPITMSSCNERNVMLGHGISRANFASTCVKPKLSETLLVRIKYVQWLMMSLLNTLCPWVSSGMLYKIWR